MVVGLPLTSPEDLLGNTASVAVLSNAAAVVFGLIWANTPSGEARRIRAYTTVCIGLYGLTVVIALLIESIGEISNTVSYVVPIASVIIVSTAIFTPIIDKFVGKAASLYLGLSLSIATISAGHSDGVLPGRLHRAAKPLAATASMNRLAGSPAH